MMNILKKFLIFLLLLITVNVVSQYVFYRFDLTQDQRYTLSDTTNSIIKKVEKPLVVTILLDGELPVEFVKLKDETQQLLEEFSLKNNNISFTYANPLSGANSQKVIKELFEKDIKPMSVTINDKGKQSEMMVFPWAVADYGDKQAKIQLIKNIMGSSIEEKINVSVQHLEYAIAEVINKLTTEKTKKIAVIKGIGELQDGFIADGLKTFRDSYKIAPFTLDSVSVNAQNTLAQLKDYDLAIIAKPTKMIDEKQVQVLDQFIMNGGKTLWLIDEVKADMDSLYKQTVMTTYPKETGLSQMFFKYGIRINPTLIKDEMATPIKLAVGQQGSQTFYENFIWKFSPYSVPVSNHPIVKNINGVKFEFANAIDLLKNNVEKTILLQSSPYSKQVATPYQVSLDLVRETSENEQYTGKGNIPIAVLLEGKFTSVYKNRVRPFKQNDFKDTSVQNKMIVVSDGDVIKNQFDQNGRPLEMGYDKWTNQQYGNKDFVINAVNYLLDDTGLISLRTKTVSLPLLQKEEVYKNYTSIQITAIGLPLIIIILLAILFLSFRKKI